MKAILDLAESAFDAGERCVMCTVVRLDGSGYGRPGARLVLTQSGDRSGYISGGCLEKDLCRRVWDATRRGPQLIAFDTRGNSIDASRYNTGCEGVVYVFCERVDTNQSLAIDVLRLPTQVAAEARMITVYRSDSPDFRIGDRMVEVADRRLRSRDDLHLPPDCESKWLLARRNQVIEFWHRGNGVEAAIEILSPPRELVVFGAGDDAIPLVRSAADLGWRVTVVGRRPELACSQRFGSLSDRGEIRVVCGVPSVSVGEIALHGRTDVVVMTHDFSDDVALLPRLLDSSARFIGLLGPKRRLGNLVKRLYENGYTIAEDDVDRIHSPVGLDIGAVTPEEIAVSILAELIAFPCRRNGGSLHRREEPLHEPTAFNSLPANGQFAIEESTVQ